MSCFNLETKKVVTRRTITCLPMPARVIRRVLKLGERCKQQRIGQCIQFLNRLKQKFSWGEGTKDNESQDLMEPDPHETDVLPAEIPGVDLEEAHEHTSVIQQEVESTNKQLAKAALQNANLMNTATCPRLQEWIWEI